MIWGIIAQGFITFLFVFSLRPVVRWTGYEFFRKSHLVVGGLYLGACWGHWNKLACWMIAALGLLGIDLGLRIVRICLIHIGYKDGNKGIGFRTIRARIKAFKDPSGTIIRMSFTHNHEPWKIGQHFYLTFPALSIWQSHPFTPASVPPTTFVAPTHTYIIRARGGETNKLAVWAEEASRGPKDDETSVILLGPYGSSVVDHEAANILAIAGGTGVSFTLPVVTAALVEQSNHSQNVEMIWIIRHVENLVWIAPELLALKARLSRSSSTMVAEEIKQETSSTVYSKQSQKRFRIRIVVTRSPDMRTQLDTKPGQEEDVEISSVSSSNSTPADSHVLRKLLQPHPDFYITYLDHQHPSIASMIYAFINDTVSTGRTQVVASGPAALGTDIRAAVASRNSAGNVWRGDERCDVDCVWDDRMG